MKRLEISAIILVFFLANAVVAKAQGRVHDRFEDWCSSLENADSVELVQFLNGVKPDEKSAPCVTWSIYELGKRHEQSAVPALIKLLDFRRPLTPAEKIGFYDRLPTVGEMFPAATALEQLGKDVLPDLLISIKANATSATARENAVAVWMELYKYERPTGVSVLRKEEVANNDLATKERLKRAVEAAVKHCGIGTPDEPACRRAAIELP